MSYLPIIVNAGQLQQLPSGQAIDVGGWTLPTSGGTENAVFIADASGNGVWSFDLADLTSLVVDDITIDGATIVSDTGSISFNDDNLYTTGKAGIGVASVYSNSHFEVVGAHAGNKYYSALHVRTGSTTYGTFLGSALSGRAIWSAGAHFATGSNWKARATSGTGIYQNLGIIQFFTNTGLTEGVDYTPTSRGYFNVSGLTVTGVVVANNITSPTDANQVLISTAPGVASFTDQIWPRLLTANETIYIRTTGNDSNDGSSVGTALATVGEGIKRLYERIADGYTITVDLDEGVYTEASAIAPAYPYGAQVEWRGISESHTSVSVSNIGSKTAGPTGLEYIDFDMTLPVTYSCSVGDFISVTSASGGTNPHLVMGIHEVTAYNGGTRVATVRSYRRSGVTPVPSGSISVNITVVKTVIYFSGSNGMVLNGAFHSGTWGKTGYGIVFKGPHTNNGLWALNGATIILGNDAGTSGWESNLFAQNNGLIFADYTCHSKSDANIVKLQNGAVVNLRGGAVLSGSRTRGVECFIGATAALDSCQIYTCGGSYGIICYKGGFVDFASGILKDGLGTGVEADTGGGVDCTSYTNNYSVATDDNAGDGSIYT